MNTDCQQLVLKLHEDHAYLQALMAQISALCDRGDLTTGCNGCASQQRTSCTSDIENLMKPDNAVIEDIGAKVGKLDITSAEKAQIIADGIAAWRGPSGGA